MDVSLKVALYCRVSTNSQTNDTQKIRLLQYASQNKLYFDLYDEVESSRKTMPVKQDLMQKLRQHKYSAVIVYRLDCWALNSKELIIDCKELIDRGINFISISDNIDFLF